MPIDPSNPAYAAFLGLRLRAVDHVIGVQGKELLSRFDVHAPHLCVSIIRLIALRQSVTVSEISNALGLSRQLVLQRLKLLEAGDFITSQTDAHDRRSRLIRLSRAGKAESRKIEALLTGIEAAFQELNEELGVDLSITLHAAEKALRRRGLLDRLSDAGILPMPMTSTGEKSPREARTMVRK